MTPFEPIASEPPTSSSAFAALSAFLSEMEALDQEAEQRENEYEVSSPCSSSTSSSSYSDDSFFPTMFAPSPEDVAPDVPATRAPPPPAATARPPPKQRIRAKHTIDKLRADAETLQNELEKLQMADKRRRMQSDSSSALGSHVSASPLQKKPRVQRVRDDVMEQNVHLRSLVEAQQKLSRQVGSVLRRMQNKQDQAILRSDVATRQEEPLSREDLVVFYDALTGKLDQLYTQLDSVFTDARLHSLDQQFADAKLMIGADLRATLQMRDVKVLPFKFETVHRVLWRHIQEESVHEGTPGCAEFLLPSTDEDVLLMRRAITVQLPSGDAAVTIPSRAVSKRFFAKDRMVFCWEGTADWPHSIANRSGAQSVPLRENGWAILKRLPGTDFSTMQMCLLMTPGLSDEHMLQITSREAMERALEKYVLPTYQELFSSRYQIIENVLFDEHLAEQ